MGFISYHGQKEDRYSDIIQYTKALQDEDWKKKEDERIGQWLADFAGDGKLIRYNLQELLKMVILQYRGLLEDYSVIGSCDDIPEGIDLNCLINDFSIDIADRHIKSFHVEAEVRQKHLQTFIDKIFKLENATSAELHIQNMASNAAYRKYFAECYDPTWTGGYYYHLIQFVGRGNASAVDSFFENYKKLLLTLGMYFFRAFRPIDNGWINQIEADITAINNIREQQKKKHIVLNPLLLRNPIYNKELECDDIIDTEEAERKELESSLESKLNKQLFFELLGKRGIDSYVRACKMLLECDLPDRIRSNYEELIKRMPVLQAAIDEFDKVYHVDMDQFDDFYVPEALKVTATLVEYEIVKPSESILEEVRENVFQATNKLLLVVNEKIDEIYKFVTIETNAEAKALEAIMSQNGYVDSQYKFRTEV